MNASILLAKLKDVRWSPSSGISVLLTELKIEHGFTGKDPTSRLAMLKPHHVKQVHGTDIFEASTKTSFDLTERPSADGVYSTDGSMIAVKTADCLPVLIASSNRRWVAAIHAGWRGLTSGILLNSFKLARQFNGESALTFVIGPAISRDRFEVGPEIIDALQTAGCGLEFDSWMFATSKGYGDRWHVDLQVAAVLQLILAGANPSNIEVIQACTFSDMKNGEYLWNSYRRDRNYVSSNWSFITNK